MDIETIAKLICEPTKELYAKPMEKHLCNARGNLKGYHMKTWRVPENIKRGYQVLGIKCDCVEVRKPAKPIHKIELVNLVQAQLYMWMFDLKEFTIKYTNRESTVKRNDIFIEQIMRLYMKVMDEKKRLLHSGNLYWYMRDKAPHPQPILFRTEHSNIMAII